ncbi:OpgC family protein [Entomobacter blattae]|uniref:OpgC family protein n=1 Tax=Entomobacter blattae TaxID=2762277 RepID=UPI0038D0A279
MDALRGVALTMMFVDHIPQNLLSKFTMRNVGFADAAEIFVILAGFASWLAYGRGIIRQGWPQILLRLLRRCVTLYIYQLCMAVGSIVIILLWRRFTPVPVDFLEPELAYNFWSWWRLVLLEALPSNLNILPLYIVLLALFPLIFLGIQWNVGATLAISGAIWLYANINPAFNFTNWLDPDGWYFDPVAWQFLFVLGVVSAWYTTPRGGSFPRRHWLVVLCWGYLVFSLLQVFPWQNWGLGDMRLLTDLASPSKTVLAPFRLLDVLAIFYLVQSSQWASRLSESRAGQILALYGRHSLEVFSAGTILDLLGRLLFVTFDDGWVLQIGVNVVGLGLLYGLAKILDGYRKKQKEQLKAKTAERAASKAASSS